MHLEIKSTEGLPGQCVYKKLDCSGCTSPFRNTLWSIYNSETGCRKSIYLKYQDVCFSDKDTNKNNK